MFTEKRLTTKDNLISRFSGCWSAKKCHHYHKTDVPSRVIVRYCCGLTTLQTSLNFDTRLQKLKQYSLDRSCTNFQIALPVSSIEYCSTFLQKDRGLTMSSSWLMPMLPGYLTGLKLPEDTMRMVLDLRCVLCVKLMDDSEPSI